MALALNGVSDYLRLSPAITLTYPVTFAAWVNLATRAKSVIIEIADAARTNFFGLSISAAGSVQAAVRALGAPEVSADSSSQVPLGGWHHAGAVFRSATERYCYLDGQNAGSDFRSAVPAGMTSNSLGGDSLGGSLLQGSLAYPGTWGASLTDSEFTSLCTGVFSWTNWGGLSFLWDNGNVFSWSCPSSDPRHTQSGFLDSFLLFEKSNPLYDWQKRVSWVAAGVPQYALDPYVLTLRPVLAGGQLSTVGTKVFPRRLLRPFRKAF